MEWKMARRVLLILGFGALFSFFMVVVLSDFFEHGHYVEQPH